MERMDIVTISHLINEWVNSLEESRLTHQCRKSGNSFFQFMQSRGVDARYLAAMIQEKLGYNPKQLCTIEDAALLRQAIYSYEMVPEIILDKEEALGRHLDSKETGRTAWKRF